MTATNIAYVGLAVLWCGALLAIAVSAWRRARLEEYRYRLFSIRDDLFMLVVKGELDEDSLVFQETAMLVNGVIRNVQAFTYGTFVRAYIEAERGNFPNEEHVRNFTEAVMESSPVVQQTVLRFYRTVLEIIVERSWLLVRTLLQLRRFFKDRQTRLKQMASRLAPPPRAWLAYQIGEARLAAMQAK